MNPASFSVTLPRISSAISAGTKLSDRMKAAAKASMMVMAIGVKVLPSTPVNISSGMNTRKMMAWPYTVGLIISWLASVVSSSRSRRVSKRPSWCWRSASLRKLFSMMITVPSTIRPKSRAPRLIRLPETFSPFMPIAIIRNENGMTSTAITAARTLPSRKNRAAATRMAPSNRFF